MKLKPVQSQVVVVVGAAGGIGRETALKFARRGARVVAFDNDERGLETLVRQIMDAGGVVSTLAGDVADPRSMEELATRAEEVFGRIDTWVHCAAVGLWATFRDTTVDEFRRVVEVNLMGQVYGAKAALPVLMRGGGGALIHVSSIEAKRALPYHSAYAAAKHGIDGFVEALRVELERDGVPVSVTEILPASINTPLFDRGLTKIGFKPTGIPPFYEPRTVAEAILHAAEHPVRDIIVGGAGKMIVNSQRLSPRLTDAVIRRVGFRGQRTNEPKSPNATNNLFGPINAYDTVEGDFRKMAFRHSLATWLDLHPSVKALAAVGASAGLGALLASRRGKTGRESAAR
jgi:NAD(P)-dependent dehydrogenase (short-subunit alcohol dehydrogenase family)